MVKNRKTIVFFSGAYLPHLGGVERYTFELANYLKKDYDVVVVTSNTENLPLESDEDGVKVFRLPIKNLPKKERLPFLKKDENYKKVLKKLRALDIKQIIIQTRFYDTTFLGLRLAKEKGIRAWLIDHSGDYVLKPYEKLIMKRLEKYDFDYYSVSNASRRFLRREFKIESKGIFYNCVKAEKDFKKPKHEKIKIVYAGRLIETKGVEKLASVFEKVKEKYNVELDIFGDGPLLEKMKNEYKDIKFHGSVSNERVKKALKESDIYVLPALVAEGFPTGILEAGMNKCAIITTKFPAMEELVSDAGLLIDRRAELLQEALENLLKNPKKIEKYGEKIRERILEKFIWEKTIEKVKKELEK